MIPGITEANFPSYATLHQATVSLQEMGERTITTQVRIDGSVTPSFEGWELRFKGERFVLPTRTPQAAKDNTTKNALVDLTFQSWVIEQLKHYFFVSLSEYETGKFIPDQYNASVILPLESFVQLFNRVLQYYFGTGIRMDLFGAGTGIYSTQPVSVEINKTYIWDVLIKFYELFGVRWYIEYEQATGAYVIKVGYAADAITDHDFEYGYKGGLLKFERNVQDADIRNILLGRGGEKNLPYRYFKLQDPQNQEWAADPDAIPELASIYFDRLRDINFRWYVRGWMQNPHRDTSWDATHTFPQYTESQCPAEHLFAFRLGKTDAKFNPVEYVKEDASITKYGERWGAVEDNDEVFPTIQGMTGTGIGRVDECVDVSDIVTDDIEAAVTEAATVRTIAGEITITKDFSANEQKTDVLKSEQFTIPSGSTGNLSAPWLNPIAQDGAGIALVSLNTTLSSVKAVRVDNGTEYDIDTPGGFPAGTYYAKITVVVKNYNTSSGYSNVTYGLQSLDLTVSTPNTEAWKPTFDIWVKNIWETTQGQSETDEQYAARVWEPILGDRVGNEAKLVFSDGFMSVSQDYEFTIASYPVKDRSKSINGVQSEWKITLFKSDAEFKATGLYVPNATTGGKPAAGDHFFFIGIDMPFLYVTKAEELLNGATMTPVANKTAALSDLADVQPTWVISLDKVRVHTLEDGEYGQTLAERLSAGATVRIKDSRFTGGQTLTLYVKSITYTWNEPTTGNPYLVPDIEVVLSDTVLSAEGTVTRVANELNVVKTTYAKSADIESTVRAVGNALFLKKTGESDRSSSPTQFASKVTSVSFRQGDIGGKGWGFYDEEPAKVQAATSATRAAATETEEKGNSVLEIDKLVVRKEMRVNSLVANQIAYVGGRQIVSAAAIECTQVVDDQAGYYCYFNQKQGTVANLFVVGDFAMGQMFDPNNLEVRYYKARVNEIGSNYILLSKTVKDGDGIPAVGDTIVQHGHESNTDRQFVIVRDVVGGGYERMLSGLDAVDAVGDEYYFAGRLASQGPRWFVGDTAGEYAEWANGRLNIKGTLVVRNSDGTYQAMTDYMSSVDLAMQQMQAQIDGQIQSWSSGEAPSEQTEPFPQVVDDVVDPSTANFPASGWTLSADREKHFGDIYVDDSTGQGYRYTKRVKNGVTEYYWTRITDEEVAEAMRLARQADQGVAGLQYLRAATNNGATLVSGGLILSNLMALGQTVSQQFQVTAGINGIMNAGRTRLGGGIAAWFGGDISDKDDLDQGVSAYAKSVFRFDGSGYLAGGNIHWDQDGYGGIPGITWSGNNIIIGGTVKLASLTGDSVTDLINLVQELSGLLEKVNIGTEANPIYAVHVKDGMGLYSDSFLTAGGVGTSGGGGGGGVDLPRVWQSLQNASVLVTPGENTKIAIAHLPSPGTGLAMTQTGSAPDLVTTIGIADGYKLPTTNEWNSKADASALAGYLPKSAGIGNPLTGSLYLGGNSVFTKLVHFSYGSTDADGYIGFASSPSKDIYLSAASGYNVNIFGAGVGIGKVASSSYMLDVNGSLNATTIYQNGTALGTMAFERSSDFMYNRALAVGSDCNTYRQSGVYYNYSWLNAPVSDIAELLQLNYSDDWISQLFFLPGSSGSIYFRNRHSGTTWTSWTLMYHSGNLTFATLAGGNTIGSSTQPVYYNGTAMTACDLSATYAPYNSAGYLPLSGGTMDAGARITAASVSEYSPGAGANYTGGIELREYQYGGSSLSDTLSNAPGITFYWSGKYSGKLALYSDKLYWGTSVILHSGNSNSTSVPWSAYSLTLNGAISGATNIDSLLYFDTTNSRVGIGTPTPAYLFDVNGFSRSKLHYFQVGGTDMAYIGAASSSGLYISSFSAPIYFYANGGASSGQWNSTGLSITGILSATGTIYSATGIYSDGYVTAGAAASSSDARLKDDIQSISHERAISLLTQLRGCEWTWNYKKDYLAGKHGSGLVAQEVEKVMPWAVLDLNGEYSLNYNTLWGVAIPVMQSHEERIKYLENRVQELESKLRAHNIN